MSYTSKILDCKLIELPKVNAIHGHISIFENGVEVPFNVKRVFYLYDIPAGESRGAHAHIECHQFLVAISGAFDVQIYDGKDTTTIRLDQPYYGLHIPPGIWASEVNFSSGAICLVMASHTYDESDYIRNLRQFEEHK